MTLTAQTKIGLTFGQIFSIILVVGAFVMGYANLQMRMNTYEQKQLEMQQNISTNEKNIEVIRTENREDHKTMIVKMDQLLFNQSKDRK